VISISVIHPIVSLFPALPEPRSNQKGVHYPCACLISWIALLAIIGILTFVNGKPVLLYSFGSYITSVLEVLTTILKIALMIPVVASMGQLKWRLFRGDRPYELAALEKFDDAAPGSLEL
jgi:hypothetical protein